MVARPVASDPPSNALLTDREDLTAGLAIFRCRFAGAPVTFHPGQYLTLGLVSDGRLVQRPYSVASSARQIETGYEFYIRLVPDGALTPRLFRLRPGDALAIRGPKGKFTLQPQDPRTHLFIASGCGIAPFMSMLRTLRDDAAPRRTVLLHGVSSERELGYREILEEWERDGGYPLSYVPTVSRPSAPENAGWLGRRGRVEAIVAPVCHELGLRAADTVAYICGHPEMVAAAETTLRQRGFLPSQIRTELYWPLTRGRGSAPGQHHE